MKRSLDRILTTHAGALPAPADFDPAAVDYEAQLAREVAAIVRRQASIGLDILCDGELGKGHWLAYLDERLGGFERRPAAAFGTPLLMQGRDHSDFPAFYAEATERGTLFHASGYQQASPSSAPTRMVCVRPIEYTGRPRVERDIRNLQAALAGITATEAFLPVTAPASIEPYRLNEFYPSEEAFLEALAEALREEYLAIARAGLVLQIDDAWTAALWDRIGLPMGIEAYKRRCMQRVEVLNHALRGIPRDQIRYHICWGSWHGPHAHDLPMSEIADVMLAVNAGAYLFEAANARHEHEYHLWERISPPPGTILIPGVVSHATNVLEHPELVSERIQRFARLVGRENVIAGTDCGLGGRLHPELVWAKLAALVEGARLATRALRYG